MSVCLSGNQEVKARKNHRCFCCNELIPAGTIYVRRSGVEPGEGFWTMKMHPECERATAHWRNTDWEIFENGTLKRATEEER